MLDSAAYEEKCESEKMMLPEFLIGGNPKEVWTLSDKQLEETSTRRDSI